MTRQRFRAVAITSSLTLTILLGGILNGFSGVGLDENPETRNFDCCLKDQPLDFSTGPIDGVTGAPGENTCAQVACHSSFALNSGNGAIAINTSTTYALNQVLVLQLTLSDPDQSRWGFELTALDASKNPAGSFQITDVARTQSSTDMGTGREYVKHTSAGTDAGVISVAPGWSVSWVAPSGDVGVVTFYMAGNAANNSLTNLGDYIYTTSLSISSSNAGCCDLAGDANNNDAVNIADAIYLINRVFGSPAGPRPPCCEEGDANGNGSVNIADAIYIINRVFGSPAGPAPICGPVDMTCGA